MSDDMLTALAEKAMKPEKLLPSTPCTMTGFDGRCCHNCQWLARDHRHCTVDRKQEERGTCVCSEQRGWVCLAPEMVDKDGQARVHSGWSEHGLCEMHDFRKKPKVFGPMSRWEKWLWRVRGLVRRAMPRRHSMKSR